MIPLKNSFQNIKIKLNSTIWITLEYLSVIFQALEYLWPQWPRQPHFTKKILSSMFSSTMAPKWPLSMWNGSSKPHYFIDFWHPFSCKAIPWDQNWIWRIKVKCPHLICTQITSNQIQLAYFFLSGPNQKNTRTLCNLKFDQL